MELKNILIQIYFTLSYLLGFGQEIPLEKVAELPSGLKECSGMVALNSGIFLGINDSGNPPEIFAFDEKGQKRQQCRLPGAENTDWESLAYDGAHTLFVGDVGNNANARRDLVIYKYKVKHSGSTLGFRPRGKIAYHYADQQAFPPEEAAMNYDLEAMIYAAGKLHLFSKNRTEPFTGYTYHYELDTTSGTQVAQKIDSAITGRGLMKNFWVSGAALDPERRTLLLLGYDKLWAFRDYPGTRFLQGVKTQYNFNHLSQKEAIALMGDAIWIADENNFAGGQHLFRGEWPFGEKLAYAASPEDSVTLLERKVGDTLRLQFFTRAAVDIKWEIFSMEGERVKFGKIDSLPVGENIYKLAIPELDFGGYVLNVLINNQPHAFPFQKPMLREED